MDRNQELELYTIPSYSSWFSWNNIHEVERFSLREFFDARSVTRSPRIYKEYRDFMISKYRENPSTKLTFTHVRKSLVGDVSLLLKVFTFLEKWGLINFNATDNANENRSNYDDGVEEEEENLGVRVRVRVKVEEGPPHGVRVVAAPNSMKPIVPPPPVAVGVGVEGGGFVGEGGFKWAPLASYSDVYGELMKEEKEKGLVCGSCKESCDSKHYEYSKEESLIICEKCFKAGNYDKTKLEDDFNFKNSTNQTAVWSEAETLLLLESVLKHGDDWDLVVKDVQTKSKLDCIAKLIELPFGDLMLGAAERKSGYMDINFDISNSKPLELVANEPQESVKPEDESPELMDKDQQNRDTKDEGPPAKRVCRGPTSDDGSSLMKQVARISTMMGPHVTTSAADAAVTALCYENQCSRQIFDDDDDNCEQKSKAAEDGNAVEEETPNPPEIEGVSSLESTITLNLRTRAASATALGAAAANAKVLADQEEREMGHLMAAMIEAQMKKLSRKMKYFEDLEVIMEKEHAQLEELEESLIAERLYALQRVFSAGITKSKELNANEELN